MRGEAISGQTEEGRRREGVTTTEEKDLKESGTKAEGRDTGRGEQRLIWHSVTSQTPNRLRSLRKVGAERAEDGGVRGGGVGGGGEEAARLT